MQNIPKIKIVQRLKRAIKARSKNQALSLAHDIAKYHFARYLVVDSYGTVKFCWSLKHAASWIAFCAAPVVRVVDTWEYGEKALVMERKHCYV